MSILDKLAIVTMGAMAIASALFPIFVVCATVHFIIKFW